MPNSRLALLVANSASFAGESGLEIPTSSVSGSIELMRQAITSLGSHSFGWLDAEGSYVPRPNAQRRISWPALLQEISTLEGNLDASDLVLFYYFGHGTVHDNELTIAFGDSKTGQADRRALSQVVDELYRVGVRKLVLVADHCHAGLATDSFQLAGPGLEYYVLAASQGGYTFYGENGGVWTTALSQALEKWNRHKIVDIGLECGTFSKWHTAASELVESDQRVSPHSVDGGLADHALFPAAHSISERVLGRRGDRTIYNRMYLILEMLSSRPATPSQLREQMTEDRYDVFLIERRDEEAGGNRYVSMSTIVNYLDHARKWGLVVSKGGSVVSYSLTETGGAALADRGSRYNYELRGAIYDYLEKFGVDRQFLLDTMRKMIASYDTPDVDAFIREMRYVRMVRSVDRNAMSFSLRMLSQAGDFRKNRGDVFFPATPNPLLE